MAKYIDYWKTKLKEVKKAFDKGLNEISIDVADIKDIGDRDEKNYTGSLTIRFNAGKVSSGQHLKDLLQIATKTAALRPYVNNELSLRITSDFVLLVSFKRFQPEDLIQVYKEMIRNGNPQEIYKWHTLSKPHWDLDAPDFTDMYKAITFHNLIYHNARRVVLHIAPLYTEEVRSLFRVLFNDDNPLYERILNFRGGMETIYRREVPQLATHQDERTIATYLSYYRPDKYALYKEEFYSRYCKMLGIATAPVNSKYVHYLELIEDFKNKYVDEDVELLQLVENFKDENCYEDDNHYVLTQDILYQTLVGDWGSEDAISDELIGRLHSFESPDAVRLFFKMIGSFIEEFDVDVNSKKLKLTDEPVSEYPIRLSAFIGNNGRALQLYKENGICYLRLLLRSVDVPDDERFFKKNPFKANEKLVNISVPYDLCHEYDLEEKWMIGCKEYLSLKDELV